jgi:hypothetical protein
MEGVVAIGVLKSVFPVDSDFGIPVNAFEFDEAKLAFFERWLLEFLGIAIIAALEPRRVDAALGFGGAAFAEHRVIRDAGFDGWDVWIA